MSEGKPSIRIIKTAARRFRVVGYDDEGEEIKELVAPAEYAVVKGDERQAVIVKTGDGWRVCKATESSRLGLAVSPVGLDSFQLVKRWAVRTFA